MGQFDMCYIQGCTTRRNKTVGKCSLYSIPQTPPERRQAWIKFVHRKSAPKKCWRVCSKHFVNGKPSPQAQNVDYAPTLNGPMVQRRRKKKAETKNIGEEEGHTLDMSVTEASDFTDDMSEDSESGQECNPKAANSIKWEPLDSDPDYNPIDEENTMGNKGACSFSVMNKHKVLGMISKVPKPGDQANPNRAETKQSNDVTNDLCVQNQDMKVKQEEATPACSSSGSDHSDEKQDLSSKNATENKKVSPVKNMEKKTERLLCMLCGQEFKWPSTLRKHMVRHEDGKTPRVKRRGASYDCTACGIALNTKWNHDKHMMTVHNQATKFVCDICGRSFIKKSGLDDHSLTHSGERPLQCADCGKSFARKHLLRNHQLHMHDRTLTPGDPVYPCEICGMKFTIESRLKMHVRKHTEPSFECKYCHRFFKFENNLKSHIRGVHEQDAKLQCTYCSKRFGNAYNLKVHVRIHTGVKPYTCSRCGKGYTDICNFRRHEQKCGVEFVRTPKPAKPSTTYKNIQKQTKQQEAQMLSIYSNYPHLIHPSLIHNDNDIKVEHSIVVESSSIDLPRESTQSTQQINPPSIDIATLPYFPQAQGFMSHGSMNM